MGRSILSNWAGLAVSGVVSFLLTPLLIHRLGAVYFGMWVLAASLLDYYGLLDIGMRTALFRFIARFEGAGQREELDTTLGTALALAMGVVVLLLALLPPLALWLPHFFAAAGAAGRAFQWTLALVGLTLAATMPARVLGSYLCGIRRFDLYNCAGMATVILRGALIAAVLLRGLGIVAVAAASLGAALVSLALSGWLVRRADPAARLRWRHASWARARQLIDYGIYAFLNVSGESLRSYTDAIVIARVLTMALVTPFSIATRLIEYFKSVISAAGGPLLGRMSEIEGRAESDRLRQCFLQSTKYFAMASALLGGLLILDGRELIRVWIGADYVSSYPLLVVLTVGYIACFSQLPSQLVVFAVARHRFLAALTLTEGVANLLLSIYWARRYGLLGVALGTAVPLLAAKLLVEPWYALWVMHLRAGEYLRVAMLRPLAVAAIFWAASGLFLRPGASLLALAAAVAAQAALFALLAWTIALSGAERDSLKGGGRRLATLLWAAS
ncbi:MAG: lipopolysaccharide biosynthesis protein [Terriglobales bacterium]